MQPQSLTHAHGDLATLCVLHATQCSGLSRVHLQFHIGFLQAEANGVLTDPAAPNAWNWGLGHVVVVRRVSRPCYWFRYMYNASSVLARLLISRQAKACQPKAKWVSLR